MQSLPEKIETRQSNGILEENETQNAENSTEVAIQTDEMQALEKLLHRKYRLIRKLGKGAQGQVYLAENARTHQKVAIKQLLISSIKDWKLYDLFHREAETLQRLDIEGVAKLHEASEFLSCETPMAVIVQDYIEGETLQKFIANGHRFSIQQIGDILLKLTDILENLHKSEPPVIHRDLKPSNIILSYRENSDTPDVHIIDFGAVSNPQVKGGGSTVVGTYGYMAPEQLMGKATAQSDLYSLAIIAFYLMSGVPPEQLEIQDFRALIDPHLEHLPHQITGFLRMMLEPKCEDRMSDYNVIRTFFKALRDQRFEDIPVASNQLSKKNVQNWEFDKIKFYNQAGNIEIWQSLSEQTPRKLPRKLSKRLKKQTKILSDYKHKCSFEDSIRNSLINSSCPYSEYLKLINDSTLRNSTLVLAILFLTMFALPGLEHPDRFFSKIYYFYSHNLFLSSHADRHHAIGVSIRRF